MNITKHVRKRYVERIAGIRNKNEVAQYTVQNSERIDDYISKLKEYAEFIWKGQLGDSITRNYYVKDDTIIITDTDNTTIITLYKANFGFPDKTNRTIIKDLKHEINELTIKYNDELEKSNDLINKKETELTNTEIQIKALEEQVNCLKENKTAIEADIKSLRGSARYIDEDIKKNTMLLVNSIEYREDLKVLSAK